jgi:hypothetical protein
LSGKPDKNTNSEQISALVYLLRKATIQRTFENFCLSPSLFAPPVFAWPLPVGTGTLYREGRERERERRTHAHAYTHMSPYDPFQ